MVGDTVADHSEVFSATRTMVTIVLPSWQDRDIAMARERWVDYKKRKPEEK
jgi:hypothetical protein